MLNDGDFGFGVQLNTSRIKSKMTVVGENALITLLLLPIGFNAFFKFTQFNSAKYVGKIGEFF